MQWLYSFFLFILLLANNNVMAQKQNNGARAIGLYMGFNTGIAATKMRNSSIQAIKGIDYPKNQSIGSMGGQIGVQFIGQKAKRTLYAVQFAFEDFGFTREYRDVPLDDGITMIKELEYDWRETLFGVRIIRLLGKDYNKSFPLYFDLNYGQLNLLSHRIREDFDPNDKKIWDNINNNVKGISIETGLYFKFINIGFKYSHYPSLFKANTHELYDEYFNNIEYNSSYVNFKADAATSLTSFELKIRLNLYLLSLSRCNDCKNGFNWGHNYS
ncbi:MAG: hypothetical protein ACPGLV_10620, partial [Bacteroidia bacterium]